MAKKRQLECDIRKLRKQNKSYSEIARILKCSKSTVQYYFCDKPNPIRKKLEKFCYTSNTKVSECIKNTKTTKKIYSKLYNFINRDNKMTKNLKYNKLNFSLEDVLTKIGDEPSCYLTGDPIDISLTSTYQFDHIIPRSRGGDNSLENLGICTKQANVAKNDMTPDELVNFCKKVLIHKGYKITEDNS